MTRIAYIAFVLIVLSGYARAQAPSPEERYTEGQKAYDAKHFDEAIRIWRTVYDDTHRPEILWNLGIAYYDEGNCSAALASFHEYFAKSTRATDDDRKEYQTYEKACTPPLPPPIAVEAPIAAPIRRDRQEVTMIPKETWHRPVGVGLLTAGVISTGLGLYFGHRANALDNEVTDACRTGCDWSIYGPKDTDGRNAENYQWVSYGAGALLVGTGVVVYLWGTNTTRIDVAPTNGGVTGAVSWTW
jgi:tetratricopeptide (TPR) repeat protein